MNCIFIFISLLLQIAFISVACDELFQCFCWNFFLFLNKCCVHFTSKQFIYLCVHSLVIDAVLIIDVQQFVFDPTDLLRRLFPSLMVQTVFLIKLSQAHHGLLTHTPLQGRKNKEEWSWVRKITFLIEWKRQHGVRANTGTVVYNDICTTDAPNMNACLSHPLV